MNKSDEVQTYRKRWQRRAKPHREMADGAKKGRKHTDKCASEHALPHPKDLAALARSSLMKQIEQELLQLFRFHERGNDEPS
jgi:hypothetical protein